MEPLTDVDMSSPPYSVTPPPLPMYITMIGKPVAIAFAEIATKYQVFVLITGALVQKRVAAV